MNKKTNSTVSIASEQVLPNVSQADQDAKNALLIVSLLVNAFILIGWITLQVTSVYDAQLAGFLFTR
ncbi:hypothetical protein HY312_02695 [Candidatus Saccharibacteria bacterium]|nr:hypothetical protein [Candidatus Saccharibacteria bacterium]